MMLSYSRKRGEVKENDFRLMWRCAVRRYRDGESLSQIGEQIGLPRAKVSQLVEDAVRMGIVKIDFDPPRLLDLETDLIDQFGLKMRSLSRQGVRHPLRGGMWPEQRHPTWKDS